MMPRVRVLLELLGVASLACLAIFRGPSMQAGAIQGGTNAQASTQTSSPQNPGGFVLRSQVNLVLVDVRVWDKSGHIVTDLKQQDFKILEEGVPQTISSFSLESVERLATAAAENGPPPTIDLGKLPPNVPPAQLIQDRRLLVLFFDLTSMAVDDLIRATKSATDFVHKQLTPADLVAVAIYSSTLRVLQSFTNDRDALDKALKSITVGESSSLAEAGSEGEAGTTNANGEAIVTRDVSDAFTPDETEFNIFNTDEKLAALESLARMLRDVPGRKSVIHFSSGIERTGIENQAQLRAASDAANQANVSVYTVDARGLAALPPGGDASSASPSGTALYTGQAFSSQVSSLQGGRETLATLAADTGGRTFNDINDFSQAFREVQNENSSYYLLGYSPSNARSDGKFRRIRVVINRPGIKVVARPGYFAPKDFRQFTREDKELQLEQAMDVDTYRQVLGGNILYEGGFELPAGNYHLKVVARENESGKLGTFEEPLVLPDAAGSGLSVSSVVVSNQLQESAREGEGGGRKAKGRNINPLQVGSRLLLPSVTRVFRTNQKLYVYLESYECKARSEGGSKSNGTDQTSEGRSAGGGESNLPPSVALVFFRSGVQISEAGPFVGKLENERKARAIKVAYFMQ